MKLSATIAGVIGITAVAGTLVFKTDVAEKVADNIEALKNKIVAFADNEDALVKKYYSLKEDAEAKIAKLEKEITDLENNATADASEIQKLKGEKETLEKQLKLANEEIERLTQENTDNTSEIERLVKELEKANAEVGKLEEQSNKAIEETNEYEPTKPETLPGLDIATATASFQVDKTQVSISLKEDIDISYYSSKGNVEIEFVDANGNRLKKGKSWDGYLNSQGIKYGQGLLTNDAYLNGLKAGETYTTTLSVKNKPFLSKIDPTKIVEVNVTVTNNDGEVHKLDPIKK